MTNTNPQAPSFRAQLAHLCRSFPELMLQRPSSSGTAPVCVAVVCAGLSVPSLRKCPLLLNRDPANTAGRAEGRA